MFVDQFEQTAPPELDYRFFRYSKLALPFLLFILLNFITLSVLTMWQSRSDIRKLNSGIPRDLQPPPTSIESGIGKQRRNVRIAISFLDIFFGVAALIVFFADLPPIIRARLNYLVAIGLLAAGVLAWIGFGLDMNYERPAKWCTYDPNQTSRCQSREDLATGCTVFDAFVAVFAITSGLLIIAYTYTGDWARERIDYAEGILQYGYPDRQPGLIPNGVSTVRKKITLLAIIFAVIFGIILYIFTIILHEQRVRLTYRDSNNRPITSGIYTIPGWPMQNTKLRYATCGFIILTALFNLIPLTSRVIAYILGFLYILYSIMSFTCFGLDIDSLESAKRTNCPDNIQCVYHPYNTTIALDFIGGFVLVAYVAWEYFVSKKSKQEDPIVV